MGGSQLFRNCSSYGWNQTLPYETHYTYYWLLHHSNSLSTFIYSLIPSLPNPCRAGVLCATVVKWGWSEYQNMSQHRKLILESEKKTLPLTPRTRTCDLSITSQVLYHWASPHSLRMIYRYASAKKKKKKESNPHLQWNTVKAFSFGAMTASGKSNSWTDSFPILIKHTLQLVRNLKWRKIRVT